MVSSYPIRHVLTKLGELTAHPSAFAIVVAYAVSWFVLSRDTFDWHAVAVLATWLMTLVIQRSEHRDTQAIHAKLDELLHVQGEARNDLTHLDEAESEDIVGHRRAANAGDERR